ncbi:hypothetical protein PS15m_012239 [Mucor circinelloides]
MNTDICLFCENQLSEKLLGNNFCSKSCRAKEQAKSAIMNQPESATSETTTTTTTASTTTLYLKKEKSIFRSTSASFIMVDNPHRRLSVCLLSPQDLTTSYSIKENCIIQCDKDTI